MPLRIPGEELSGRTGRVGGVREGSRFGPSPEHEAETLAPLRRGVRGPGAPLLSAGVKGKALPPFGRWTQPSRWEGTELQQTWWKWSGSQSALRAGPTASPDRLDVGAREGGLPGSRGVPAEQGRMELVSAGGWEARPVCARRTRLGGCVLDCPAVTSGGQAGARCAVRHGISSTAMVFKAGTGEQLKEEEEWGAELAPPCSGPP